MENFWLNALWSLTPTVAIGLIFWFIMRSVIRMDRTERRIYARIKDQERAKLQSSPPPTPPSAA